MAITVIDKEDTSFFHQEILAKKFLSQSITYLTKPKVINSATLIERAIQICLDDS